MVRSGPRRRGREAALAVLFQVDLNPMPPEDGLARVFQAFDQDIVADPEVRRFAETLVSGVYASTKAIDEAIEGASLNWRMARMAVVDRSILRLAAYELLFCEDVPLPVVLDEAVELAKRFGGEDSPSFVNGVLDNLANEVERQGSRGSDELSEESAS